MPEQKAMWEKIGKNARLLAAIILVFVSMGFFLLSYIAFIQWVISGFQLGFLIVTIFFFGLFIAFGLVALQFKQVWKDLESRRGYVRPTPIDTARTLAKGLVIVLLVVVGGNLLERYVLSYPDFINSSSLAIEMLKIIIQVNGILVGFSGIVFAQLLWAIHSRQNVIQEDMLRKVTTETAKSDARKETLKRLEAIRASLFVVIAAVVIPFVISILVCLVRMAWIPTYGDQIPTRAIIGDSLNWTFVGIVYFFIFMMSTRLTPEEREKR